MKTYRCKHAVEAMRWFDTDESREIFAAWFESHGQVFETQGPIACLSNGDHADPGLWIVYSDGEFLMMDEEMFRDQYEEVA